MKFSSFNTAVALTCFLSTVSAKIDLTAPSNPVSGGGYTVTWAHESSDPDQFILMLQLASDSWATGQFWEFTETKLDKLDVTFLNTDPYVISTKSIYRLTARNQSNVDQVYSQSPTFQFLPPGSTVTTAPNTTTAAVATSQNSTTVVSTTSSTTAAPTTTSPAVQQTTTSPAQTSTTSGEASGGVLSSNSNAAELSVSGGVVGILVAVLAANLASLGQF